MAYQVPRLPLSVFSGYIGLLAGLQLSQVSPYRAACEVVERVRSQNAIKGGANGLPANEVDWSKGLFILGSCLMVGLMATGRDTGASKGTSEMCLWRPSVNRPPPASYTPTPSETNCCAVCLTHARDTVVDDCQHLIMCWACFEGLREKKCPACQGSITSATFTYSP
eukprot:TRINITY_DN10071_c0_g1_i1.p1 TRINITY_DN10071_c0_g1~~TRINITY_DN10071_c0_g1_i1.p1  ORF type:complete len:167 (+),score=17.24 TRINITY_DN10071_c0_g1_i1:129-629(+)